jgi:hypothetical protein
MIDNPRKNPYRPGVGLRPLYLAGEIEDAEILRKLGPTSTRRRPAPAARSPRA